MSHVATGICPCCEIVELEDGEIWLELFYLSLVDMLNYKLYRLDYVFTCPGCNLTVRHEASDLRTQLLDPTSITEKVVLIPLGALKPHPGPPLTEDDLIEFGRRLYGLNHGRIQALAMMGIPA